MIKRKVFLVDTENVATQWLSLFDTCEKTDKMVLFYTTKSPHIAYSDIKSISDHMPQIEMVECFTGINALDFQLVTYLGYLIKSAPKTEYIIVSNDMGFDSVVNFWNKLDTTVTRQPMDNKPCKPESKSVKRIVRTRRQSAPKTVEKAEADVEPVQPIVQAPKSDNLGEIEDISLDKLMTIISDYGISDKQKIYTELTKAYGQQDGLKVYRAVKSKLPIIAQTIK